MKWTEQAKDQWVCLVAPEDRFRLEVSPKGDGRWDWRVFARAAVNPMASGIARNLGAAKSVAEQFVARNS
jgi:hypothetical protein